VANKARELIPVALVAVLFATVTKARLKAIKLCAKPSSKLATFVAVGTIVGVVANVVCRVGHGFGFRFGVGLSGNRDRRINANNNAAIGAFVIGKHSSLQT
jgi:hypothetical protein